MIGKRGALKYGLNNNRRLELRITVEFETKPNANTNIMLVSRKRKINTYQVNNSHLE